MESPTQLHLISKVLLKISDNLYQHAIPLDARLQHTQLDGMYQRCLQRFMETMENTHMQLMITKHSLLDSLKEHQFQLAILSVAQLDLLLIVGMFLALTKM